VKKRILALGLGIGLVVGTAAAASALNTTSVKIDLTGESVTYAASSTDPSVAAVEKTGLEVTASEEGVINHGMFVSTLAKAAKGMGFSHGCLVSLLAQSDWPVDGSDSLSLEADCVHGAPGTEDADDDGQGPPAHVQDRMAARDAGEWTPGDGPPPWANGDGTDDTEADE